MNALYTMTFEQTIAFLDALHISYYDYTCFDENHNALRAISIANGRFHVFFDKEEQVSSIADY